jgi:hypothetical protein
MQNNNAVSGLLQQVRTGRSSRVRSTTAAMQWTGNIWSQGVLRSFATSPALYVQSFQTLQHECAGVIERTECCESLVSTSSRPMSLNLECCVLDEDDDG